MTTNYSEQNNASRKYKHTNDLIDASSPYLRQHAHNPVDWHAWEDALLKRARDENKILLISIGYSACHWCHVMEHESFSDEEVADFMNEHFIAIKVDREERPDIDQIYMNASLLLNGSGGWPLNAFALPDGRPFYVMTYLPRKQWLLLLRQLVGLYKNEKEKIEEQADALTDGVRRKPLLEKPADSTRAAMRERYSGLWENIRNAVDLQRGGLGKAPKFPMPAIWDFLLQHAFLTGNKAPLKASTATLDHMAKGGIFDQLGGGFARYSVDVNWHVPHFEKMLYDNAQLVSLYAHAFQYTRQPLYEKVIRATLDFIRREMTGPGGGFFSALNADSEGEEGKFYIWRTVEVRSVLKQKEADLFLAYYQMTEMGNWEEGKNILHAVPSDAEFAASRGIGVEGLQARLKQAEKILLTIRDRRPRPSTDDKMLTSWNALMIKAYVDAYRALGEKTWMKEAVRQADFLLQNMMATDHKLYRCYKNGKVTIEGMLDDYACLAEALIHLYQVTFDTRWLQKARGIADYVNLHFRDETSGMFFYTSDLSDELIARNVEVEDNVIPSSNAVMAQVLYCLGRYYDEAAYLLQSRTMLHAVMKGLSAATPYYAYWAKLLGWFQAEPTDVVITGKHFTSLNAFLQRHYLPHVFFSGGNKEDLPLLKGRIKGDTVIYVCKDKSCMAPTADRYAVLEQCIPSDVK